MQLQISENAIIVPAPEFEGAWCRTISNESKVTYRSSKINLFAENNTKKALTKTVLVSTDNHNNYNVLEEIFVIFA